MADKSNWHTREELQKNFAPLLNHLTKHTGTNVVVLNPNGEVLHDSKLHGETDSPCSKDASCAKTFDAMFEASKKSPKPIVSVCEDTGLPAAALPIYTNGKHVFTWLLCNYDYDEKILKSLWLLLTALSQPIIDLQKTSQSASLLAYTDLVTGVPNRYQLEKDIAQSQTGSLLLLDIPDLRKLNEAYGRATGDALLCTLRDHLLNLDYPESRLYRLNAAKFGLWVKAVPKKALLQQGKLLLEKCRKPWNVEVGDITKTVTFTGAVGILPLEDLKNFDIENISYAIAYVIGQAEQTHEVALFDNQKNQGFRKYLSLVVELRHAVAAGMQGFSLVYQPLVDTSNSLWKGVEALCRWQSKKFGAVSPAEFIPIAEQEGLISTLGLWVLEQAIKDITTLGIHTAEQFVLDVNLSPLQLSDTKLVENVLAILEKYGFPASKLCLEITESSDIDFSGYQLETLGRLRTQGLKFALDDFGVGYASLSSLHRLPVDMIKTDRSLVENVENNLFLQRLFYVMGELAHINGMKIVAEGVETDSQVRTLLMEGADYFQGFKFSKPMALEDLQKHSDRFYISHEGRPEVLYRREDFASGEIPQGSYALPPSLYSILNRCMHVLFTGARLEDAINEVLQIAGEALHVSRAYVYLRSESDRYVLTHDWCASGLNLPPTKLPSLRLQDLGPEWLQRLVEEEMLVVADTNTLPKEMREMLTHFNVKAFAEFSLMLDGSPMGTLNFNDCTRTRYWAKEDLQMMQLLANMLAGVLCKNDLRLQLKEQKETLQAILDQIDALVYITDPDTGRVLFANQRTKDTFGIDETTGLLCWETIQGQNQKCPFCPFDKARQLKGQVEHYELYNEKLGDYLQIGVSTIQWQENQEAMLCTAFNINDLIDRQQRLEKTATMDALTGVHNRQSFLDLAAELFKKAKNQKKTITLAFLDVDGLKHENDVRGHRSGDALLCSVVNCLRQKTRDTDLIGRYGGDEFIILFYGCEPANAIKSLENVLADLATLDEPEIQKYHSFSYGLVSTREHLYQPGMEYLDGLISIADARMIAYKNKKHPGGRDTPL